MVPENWLARVFIFRRFFALVKADRSFKHQKDVVAGSFDLADGSGDAIGIGKRFVDRVAQLLHEFLQSIFQGNPLSLCHGRDLAPQSHLQHII